MCNHPDCDGVYIKIDNDNGVRCPDNQPTKENAMKITNAWRVKASIIVEGPSEGPVIISAELPETTKEHALKLQAIGVQLVADINSGKV